MEGYTLAGLIGFLFCAVVFGAGYVLGGHVMDARWRERVRRWQRQTQRNNGRGSS